MKEFRFVRICNIIMNIIYSLLLTMFFMGDNSLVILCVFVKLLRTVALFHIVNSEDNVFFFKSPEEKVMQTASVNCS